MKRRILALAATLTLAFALLPAPKAEAAAESINVYNWGQYISDGSDGYIDVNAAFEEATGIKVNYMTFDSNESMYTKLKTGGSSYDVIIPSDYMIARLIDEDMLLPLDFSNIPNYRYIDDAYKNAEHDPENIYSVPYTWGTVGVIWNSRYVDEADTGGWDLLWNEKYAGKILMFDNPRDSFAIAEKMLDYSINTRDPDELRAAAYKLIEQKPLIQAYVMDQIFDKMERGEAWIAPYYAGDYLLMAEENEDLEFYFPEEGFNFFIDAMCIPKPCTNKAGAEAYINFLCDPEVCGENLEYLGYSATESAAKEYMDEEMNSSEIAYPSEEVLAKGEVFQYLDSETTHLMDSLWLQVKTEAGDNTDYTPIIGILTVVVLVGGGVAFSWMRDRRRRANRCRKWTNV
ncbi:MAG: spermidine/putrescine ABC transporter substrate-binding protein [Oscillospiraceae bacterium]|nr:spermidine/putrescine ABC transporter substrate-binding protein [Oscillospiraceae bacterium]